MIYLIIVNFYFHFLFAVGSLGGGLLFGQGSQKESCGKVFFLLILFPPFFFLFLFGWCSLGQVNPRLIQAIHQASHLSSQLMNGGVGEGGGMHMYE